MVNNPVSLTFDLKQKGVRNCQKLNMHQVPTHLNEWFSFNYVSDKHMDIDHSAMLLLPDRHG